MMNSSSSFAAQPDTLVVILGDQLSMSLSSLTMADKRSSVILMAELRDETDYVRHHKKKLVLVLSAMRHFASELSEAGWKVRYVPLSDADNTHNFTSEVKRAVTDLSSIENIIVTHSAEWRVQQQIESWAERTGCDVQCLDDDRFFTSPQAFADWADGRKQLRMEYFYREMRRQHHILMDGTEPEGGQWNYDAENRQPPKDGLDIPAPTECQPDDVTIQVISEVETHFDAHFGDIHPFYLGVTSAEASQVLKTFIESRLADFGSYQDAMITDEPFMFHAHIGFYLNLGLLSPRDAVAAAEKAYREGKAPLNAVEGFIRQILGWREYVRGLYWLKMPEYKSMNALEAHRPLPSFFWSGQTKMKCLSQVVYQTRKYAYAHHIQRLMVVGNFALLAGLSPDEVNDWFMIVYADAYEWVELPNVTGMALFADGGIMASKPYASGGSYIDRMSDYCKGCEYKVKVKNGEDACPFNYLYWDFLERNAEKLSNNPRLGMMYKSLSRMADEKRQMIRQDAARFLEQLS